MEAHSAYIPMDRRQSLVRGISLPSQTTGAALFADISGFTPLTEALLRQFGPKRGAEELSRLLNEIYDALVGQVHHYGGSVLAFSGDAITCWLDGDNGLRATACGLAMQQEMRQFAAISIASGDTVSLAMKVGIAAGQVRRFMVGDPGIQYIDTLAGSTLDVVVDAEHHAEKGEVVVSPHVVANIFEAMEMAEWRGAEDYRFGVVGRFKDAGHMTGLANPWPALAVDAIPEETAQSWVLPPVHARLQAGQGEFLAELRPAVSLFLSFGGLDFDHDEQVADKLDAYVRWVQNVLFRYEGFLLQLTIGDKGSYLYSAFGAPVAHEDDAIRAVSAALELIRPPADLGYITESKIGISQGQMRTGAYGGTTRRTYGVLGDEVNLSARLMQAAQPGQVLVKDTVWHMTGETFLGELLPSFMVKGKTEPVTVYGATGLNIRSASRLQAVKYALPMVGREAELEVIRKNMEQAVAGEGRIVAIVADAGMGKSRLVAEVIRLASERQLVGYGGACQSYGTNISYLVWQPIWQALFNVDPSGDETTQIESVRTQLADINPVLVERLPLLGPALNLSIPHNDLTAAFDAKLRKDSLESLLVDYLRARTRREPLLLVLEDCHWLDPLSHDLLEVIGRAIADLAVMLVLNYRPLQLERLKEARVENLPHFSEVQLTDFTPAEAERLIALKLEQLFGEAVQVPRPLIRRVLDRAQGNPFYIEELINLLQDQGIDLNDAKTIESVDLPDSLHSLILTRIDQLTEHQKSTIKVASVIGRLFEAGWLWGMYPELGEPEEVRKDLEVISRIELAPLDKPDPELSYIFKHVVTQEVTYESLPYAMRAILHDQLARFIERRYADQLDRYIFLLAFHFDRSENQPKKREYLRWAGELAQLEYSNETALDYYQRLLPLLPEPDERIVILIHAGEVLSLAGRYEESLTYFAAARFFVEGHLDSEERARLLAELCRKTADVYDRLSEYDTALEWLQQGLAYLDHGSPLIEAARIYNSGAAAYRRQGNYDEAIAWCKNSLAVASQIDNHDGQRAVGQAYYLLGDLHWRRGNMSEAVHFCLESVQLYERIEDKVGLSDAYNNLNIVYSNMGNWDEAGVALSQSLALKHEIGDVFGQGVMANNLAYIHLDRGEWDLAAELFEESYQTWRQLGSAWGEANLLSNLAQVQIYQGQWDKARSFLERSEALFNNIGSEEFLPELERRWGEYFLNTGDLDQALSHIHRSIETAAEQKALFEEGMSLRILGEIYLARGEFGAAGIALHQSHQILTDLESEVEAARTAIPMARLAVTNEATPGDRALLEQAIAIFEKVGAFRDFDLARELLDQMV